MKLGERKCNGSPRTCSMNYISMMVGQVSKKGATYPKDL
jgi:hypothetical protein